VLSRRRFLAALAASAVVGACSDSNGGGSGGGSASARRSTDTTGPLPRLDGPAFTLGVASGDPTPDSVILWTRLATDPVDGGGMPDADLPVVWELAGDERISDVVASGVATASPRLGHSVHVDAQGLDPARTYWYRFRVGDEESPVGRTRTAPAEDATPERLRFGFASCSHWQDGYWTAYPHLAEEDLDLVVFLGDYIYEGDPDPEAVRVHNSPRVMDLEGYRNRYGLYKGDAGLQAVHAAFPWVSTWDDHEVANDYGSDVDPRGAPPEQFLQRRAEAYQAWYEHLPVRLEPPTGPDYRINRTVPFGRLAAFHLLDERQYRSAPVCGAEIGPVCDEATDPARTMLGEDQERWLADQLDASPATWDVLANSVVLSKTPVPIGDQVLFNLDQWDGYPPARQRVLDLLAERRDGNRVVITGDIHASGVADMWQDFEDDRSPVIGTELVGTSVSSEFDEAYLDIAEEAVRQAPWVQFFEARRRGYVAVEATSDALRADYRLVAGTATPESTIETASSWVVEAGKPGAQEG
jgi:alkaline phosphatase D